MNQQNKEQCDNYKQISERLSPKNAQIVAIVIKTPTVLIIGLTYLAMR